MYTHTNPLPHCMTAEPQKGFTPDAGRRSIVLEEFRPHHLPQVITLYRLVFGERAATDFMARWCWSQENNLFPANTPKWVLSTGDYVVGFLTTVPQPYLVNGQTVVAHTPSDYMVHPDFRFHGIKLMQACFRECSNIVTCDDMAATRRVTRWLGADSVGSLVRYAKLLDPRALRGSRVWSRLPAPLAWSVAQAVRLRDRLHEERRLQTAAVTQIDDFDDRFDTFLERLAEHAPITPARNAQFLNWRYGPDSPHATRRIGVVEDLAGELVGYVVTHRSAGALRPGRILDLQYLPETGERVAPLLLAHALAQLRQAGAWIVYYHRLDTPFALPTTLLARRGFLPRGRHELLTRFNDEALNRVASTAANWAVSYGDSEASHGVT